MLQAPVESDNGRVLLLARSTVAKKVPGGSGLQFLMWQPLKHPSAQSELHGWPMPAPTSRASSIHSRAHTHSVSHFLVRTLRCGWDSFGIGNSLLLQSGEFFASNLFFFLFSLLFFFLPCYTLVGWSPLLWPQAVFICRQNTALNYAAARLMAHPHPSPCSPVSPFFSGRHSSNVGNWKWQLCQVLPTCRTWSTLTWSWTAAVAAAAGSSPCPAPAPAPAPSPMSAI